MRHLMQTLAATGLLLLGANLAAQARLRDEVPGVSRDSQIHVLNRAWSDLSTSDTLQTPLSGDFPRIERAMQEVTILEHNLNQQNVNEGEFDARQFDPAIGAMEEVIRENVTLAAGTLDTLAGDLRQLKILRNASMGSSAIARRAGR
jgi:hypothetical protein